MNFDPRLLTTQRITVIGRIVAELEHVVRHRILEDIAGNRPRRLHLRPALVDDVPGRSHRLAQSPRIKPQHIGAVGLQHLEIARLRMRRLREPPDVFHRILHAHPPHCHPFRWHGHLRGIVPIALLREEKSDLLHQRDQQLVLVK